MLAREVHPAELCDRVVAVVEEDTLVELFGTVEADRCVDRVVAADVEIADELVEEQAPERLVTAAVAGEERPLDHLWQVDESEHRTVEVGEVAAQHIGFVRGEGLRDVHSHDGTLYGPTTRGSGIWKVA